MMFARHDGKPMGMFESMISEPSTYKSLLCIYPLLFLNDFKFYIQIQIRILIQILMNDDFCENLNHDYLTRD